MENINNFKIWTEIEKLVYIVYDYSLSSFEILDNLPRDVNSFYLPKSYSISKAIVKQLNLSDDEYLEKLKDRIKQYSIDLIADRNQIINASSEQVIKIKFDYFDNSTKNIFYRTHSSNVKTFFKMLCKDRPKDKYKFDDFETISLNEYRWFKSCCNGGLMYLKEPNKYYDVFGYDYQMNYPTNMSSIAFQIPIKQGEEKSYSRLPEHLKYGIYRVKITSNDVNFKKIFNFSKEHHYTHYSLKFALKLQKKLKIDIDLILDGKPNALVYSKDELIHGNQLFGNWFNVVKKLKTAYPKNGLVKALSSGLWGHICEVKTLFKNEDEIIRMVQEGKQIGNDLEDADLDYVIIDMINKQRKKTTTYELIDTKKNIYDFPIRLLPFITSYSRTKMAEMINHFDLYDNLIRIQTDGMILNKKFEELETSEHNLLDGLKPDKKITGHFEFYNLNEYEPITKE